MSATSEFIPPPPPRVSIVPKGSRGQVDPPLEFEPEFEDLTFAEPGESIDANVYGKYRKALVAGFGVLLVSLGLFSDGAWTFEDTRTLVETLGIALGIYEVPNDR